ncbi:mammalian ependymin-related protein 1-like [Physella acuta]|uniref:mammalian ependymin-related protein 1-like n=1 Tax=Physella acuta TaxID=109671 RepID=UPI0027DE45BC|nr:mammalian ependymin-related protein 1-like [Physella acuta]
MFNVLALTLLGAAVVYGQIPHHCFSPPQLTFRANQYNHEFTTFRRFDAEYDAMAEKIAFDEVEQSGPQPGRQYLKIIILHRENLAFEYNRQTKVCKKFDAGRFFPFAVPENATFEAEFIVGGPGEEVEGVEWSDRSSTRREEWIGVFSRINCYPLRSFIVNTSTNETLTTLYYDLVQGLVDPNFFIPPPECLQATHKDEPSSLFKSLRSTYTRRFD